MGTFAEKIRLSHYYSKGDPWIYGPNSLLWEAGFHLGRVPGFWEPDESEGMAELTHQLQRFPGAKSISQIRNIDPLEYQSEGVKQKGIIIIIKRWPLRELRSVRPGQQGSGKKNVEGINSGLGPRIQSLIWRTKDLKLVKREGKGRCKIISKKEYGGPKWMLSGLRD